MSSEKGDCDDALSVPDPTLTGPDAQPAGEVDGFPDTAVGTHLVLYQTQDGAVDVRWRIDSADIAHARAAFGGADAHAVLRLYHLGGNGDDRLMADADLGSDTDAEDGLAHYAGDDAEGLLQAEIGLASADGGWLLVARSNGLPAAAPVGSPLLRGHAFAPAATAVDTGWTDAAIGPDAGGTASTGAAPAAQQPSAPPEPARPGPRGSEPVRPEQWPEAPLAPEPLRLEPEFPLVEPDLSPLTASGAAAGPMSTQAPGQGPAETSGTGGALVAGGDPAVSLGTGLAAAAGAGTDAGAERPGGGRAPVGPAAAAGGIDVSLGPAGYAARLLGDAGAQSRLEPPPGGVVPRLTQRPPPRLVVPPPAEQSAQREPPASSAPVPGSGPVRPAAGEATLTAELVVHGSAPPNTLLDLSGHAYRVGPGGRFQLRIPIREREVILRVLASLPRLPVDGRTDDEAHPAAEE